MADTLQYYPTPAWLVDKAWAAFSDREFVRVLDACAGTGALADGSKRIYGESRWNRSVPVDCIEVDMRHHPTLREKGYKVVALDFLGFEGGSVYSHVILNPPFASGAAHVLKAWDSLWTGEVVAIINAESLRNACSNERRRLAQLVEQYGSCEFIKDAFKGEGVEREAEVEVALLRLQKPASCAEDWIGPVIEGLNRERPPAEEFHLPRELALPNSFVTNQCIAFRTAVKAMREAVRAAAVAKVFEQRIGKTMSSLASDSKDETGSEAAITAEGVRNELSKRYDELKDRAWASVLRSTEALTRLSQKVQRQAESRFEEIKALEFSETTVYGFLLGLVESQPGMQLDMACDVFDQVSKYHPDNVVLYRGWKSNAKHRTCGMRIKSTRFIIPGNATDSYSTSPRWETQQMLADFDKVMALLDGREAPAVSLCSVFSTQFEALKRGERVRASYFDVRYYRQAGTIHFYPRSQELMDRLNRWVGHHRRWMPPPDQQGTDTFWRQYELAESMDRAVRVAIDRQRRAGAGYLSRWDNPVHHLASDHEEYREPAQRLALAGIESVLAERGLLEALDAEEQSAIENPPPQQLLLLAA